MTSLMKVHPNSPLSHLVVLAPAVLLQLLPLLLLHLVVLLQLKPKLLNQNQKVNLTKIWDSVFSTKQRLFCSK